MKPVIAVLGGSTPFTAALVEALLAQAKGLPAAELRLFGQDAAALERMRRYGARRLGERGWSCAASVRLDEAVDGAAIVINQIRFGGMEGRGRDEELAARFQLPADETLGPCGLSAALRVVPRMRALGAELGRRCADAWLLNLANPLSLTTAALLGAGGPRSCVGLCELPRSTALETCRLLGLDFAQVQWSYAGLNHRGLVHGLRHRGEELLPQLPEMLGAQSVFGVTAADIRRVGALPLKYFRLAPPAAPAAGRAQFLTALKEDLARELEQPPAPPPGLARRSLDWYEGAVVPMIDAIFARDGREVMVNCLREDGLVAEVAAQVTAAGLEPIWREAPAHLQPWLDQWTAHERALLEAVEAPGLERVEAALALDPWLRTAQTAPPLRELARAVLAGAGYDN